MQVKPIDNRTDLRQQAEQLIDAGDFAGAYTLLKAIWQEQPGPASARYLLSKSREIAAKVPLINCRVALLRSFTVEPIIPLLQAAALVQGIEIEIYLSDFNTYAQEILNPQSGLYQFNPNVVFFAVQTRDLVPTLWEDFVSLSQEKYQETIEQARSNLISLFEVFQKNSPASLVVHTLEQLHLPSQGILDWQMEVSQAQAITAINQVLYQKALRQTGLYLLDYDGLISRVGRSRWYDESKWLTMRMPIAADCLIHLANEWLRFLHPLTGRICKCLVVDLDNTLWGGVIGEEGMIGIALGSEYPGAAFRQFQQAILDLYKRGIVLAICSKNNPTEAIEVLEKHPDMLLRLEHFAAIKINWQDKAQNLQEIARELNIGIDSLAFVDDNPAEREWIQQQLPEVTVIDLPSNPLGYAAALRQSPVFERLTLSSEDSQRGRYYAEQRQRQALAQSATSLEDFY
jgi:HAD superfamily phosphatase (TIGR01681 family)